jgi:hypothetical protein
MYYYWCRGLESNQRPPAFQTGTLPTELPLQILGPQGEFIAAPGDTETYEMVGNQGFEPHMPEKAADLQSTAVANAARYPLMLLEI